ncbi:MAG TPA: FlgD immunoglobulin-like domain containing protein [Candidatus Krumholzibacterium sp.]|nr:FlgD immunoglobulin-like domain containing protein [Candidatus Krumholzibacterium sp.]
MKIFIKTASIGVYRVSTALVLAVVLISLSGTGAWCQQGWQTDVRLSDDPSISFPPPNNGRCIAVDGDGRVHVVWADDRDRNFEIYHTYRSGGIWSMPERLTTSAEDSKRPVLAVDGLGRVHLVWNDLRDGNKEIYHRIWDGSWGFETRVSDTPGDSYASCIVSRGLEIHLVYQEEVDGYLQIIYRSFDVFTWSAPEQVSFVESGMSMVPTIAVEPGGRIHVAWWDTREDPGGGAPGKVAYRYRDGTWSDEEIVSGPEADAMRPNICVDDSGVVHVAWIDKREPFEQIYYNRCEEGGWTGEVLLTGGDFTHYHPSLSLSAGRVHLVYWANLPSAANPGVFYMQSDYSSWTGSQRISDPLSIASLCAMTAEPNGTLHVAWKDLRDGNEEIYYNTYIPPGTGTGDTEDPSLPDLTETPISVDISPNPSTGESTISFSIPRVTRLDIRIYDAAGRLVRTLADGTSFQGTRSFVWDGRNDRGAPVARGVYFIRGRAGKQRIAAKLLLIR